MNFDEACMTSSGSLAFDAMVPTHRDNSDSHRHEGEIFNLTWFDVDLLRGVIHIRVSKNGEDRFVPIRRWPTLS